MVVVVASIRPRIFPMILALGSASVCRSVRYAASWELFLIELAWDGGMVILFPRHITSEM